MAKKIDILSMYKPEVKIAHSKVLDADVKYRALTRKENSDFKQRIIKGFDPETNSPILDIDKLDEINLEKACAMLVEPKITPEELNQIDAYVADALVDEILSFGEEEEVTLDKEGN